MTFGRMNTLAFELERGIRAEGHRTGTYIYHTPAIRCSCVDDGGQPLPSCRICGGDGFYHPASLEKKYLAIMTNAVTSREMIMGPGITEREDILVTFISPPLVPAHQDRIRFDRSDLLHLPIPAEGFIIERGTGAVDELPQRVARLISVVRSDPRYGLVTNYRPGIDVTFDGNKLTWAAKLIPPTVGATMPPTGTQYAVTYHGDYDWLVAENLAPRRPRALVRRRYTDQRNIEREGPTGPDGFNPNLY
jgi:hypothetical protein